MDKKGVIEVKLLKYPQNNSGSIKKDKNCAYILAESKEFKKICKAHQKDRPKLWEEFKLKDEYKTVKEFYPDADKIFMVDPANFDLNVIFKYLKYYTQYAFYFPMKHLLLKY